MGTVCARRRCVLDAWSSGLRSCRHVRAHRCLLSTRDVCKGCVRAWAQQSPIRSGDPTRLSDCLLASRRFRIRRSPDIGVCAQLLDGVEGCSR